MKLMVKTTPLNDDTHKCLKVAQAILYEKYDIQMSIPDIIDVVICDIDQVVKIVLEKTTLGKGNVILYHEYNFEDTTKNSDITEVNEKDIIDKNQ